MGGNPWKNIALRKVNNTFQTQLPKNVGKRLKKTIKHLFLPINEGTFICYAKMNIKS